MREMSEGKDGIPGATFGLAFSEVAQIGRDQLERGPSSGFVQRQHGNAKRTQSRGWNQPWPSFLRESQDNSNLA
jgi:hypothetical protein